MTKAELCVELFKSGHSCSQAIVAAFAEDISLTKEQALKISTGFGAGFARLGLVCGGITGAIMVLGMKHGTIDPSDKDSVEKNYDMVQEYVRIFISRNQSMFCPDLTGFDLNTKEGREAAKEAQVRENVCEKLVADCANILEEMIK